MKGMSKTNKIIMIAVGLIILVWGIASKNLWGLLGIIPVALAFIPGSGESKKEEATHPEAPKVPGMEIKEEERPMSEEAEMPKMADEPAEETAEKMPEMNIPDEEKEHSHV